MRSAFSQAWASWKTAPGVALLAVIAFAVGIGSATAIFTVVNGVMLRPLPYPDGERFVVLYGARTNEPNNVTSLEFPEVQALVQQTTSFDAIGWFLTGRYRMTAPGEPAFVRGTAVTAPLTRQLGPPLLGQWFADENGAVISSPLWRRLGGRRDIIGSAITLDDRRYTVTGVMPPAFLFPIPFTAMTREDTDVWIALDPSGQAAGGNGLYVAYARRKPGVSVEQANADVARVVTNLVATDPVKYARHTATANGLHEPIRKNLRITLLVLFAGAGLLLLIACANVATLLLARSVVRARETAIRVALGASRSQLALRYFAEGGLVSVAGAAAGVALSAIFTRQILVAASDWVPHTDDIAIDWRVLGFSVLVALATGVLAGLAPLWQAFRTAPNTVLTEGVRASASASARRLSRIFVVGEIALAFTLLTASIILIVHLRNLDRVAMGFEPDRLVAFDLVMPRRILGTEAQWPEQQRLMAALQQTPGVMSATFANQLAPYPGCLVGNVFVDGRPPAPDTRQICVTLTTADFFAVMQIPLRAGRLWTAADTEMDLPQPLVAMISETAARTYWPGRNPIGVSGRLGRPDDGLLFEVVGVVGDVRNNGANKPPDPELYLAAKNRFLAVNPMSVIVRSNLPVDQVIGAARRRIRDIDPALVMEDVTTMNDVVHGALQLERVSSLVMTFFGIVALLMATLGIYSVMSYFVRQRTMELGTRMALGAVNRDLVALVLGGGLKLSLAGLAVGSMALGGGVWLLVRLLEVANIGWLPFASSAVVVALVSGAAASVPAWRTTLISPMAAMREQPPSVWRWVRRQMARAVRDVREAVVGTDDRESAISPAGLLTAFVDAARGAESYNDALRAVLASVCDELHVESAALLERRDAAQPDYTCLTAVGTLEVATPVIPADGFLISRLRVHPQPLPLAADELAALAQWAEAHRPERLDEIRALAAAGIRLAVPLRTRREILGVLLLGERAPRAALSAQEKQALRAGADQFALMIENARLTDRVVEQETLRRDIALASDVQRRLLPDAPPVAEFADFAAISVPARRIGGDYYDFLALHDREIGIALADVSGKGVAAALIMSVVQASLRIISSEGDVPLPKLVARMNEFVYRSTPSSKYATFFYARLDQPCRHLRYVNAGHNPPYLFRAVRTSKSESAVPVIEELSAGGTVVGMFPDMDYEEGSVELCPGDVLLAYTDGVPEAHNPENQEFGEERLQQLLRASGHLPADEISAHVSAALKNWTRDAEQYDDLTFIVMKVR